ncbi:MAG: aldehyde dehydrogenase family protein [Deltaproteobacteria bacterium]|nr:aldehyde dehydrogenase family protein [Deltaproteobacteria bacterium]
MAIAELTARNRTDKLIATEEVSARTDLVLGQEPVVLRVPELIEGGVPLGSPSSLQLRATGTAAVSLQASRGRYDDPSLSQLFPTMKDVPAQFGVNPKDNPPTYLVDGKVETFGGPSKAVESKIAVRDGGMLKPVILGYEPQLTAVEAERATAAAVKAFDGGDGAWPRATPETRIAAVAKFADLLEATTERVATLLMWEIGKSYPDAKKEVSRSVEYIRATLDEYRALLRESTATLVGPNGAKPTHFARDLRQPRGVVLCVGPYNYPVNEFLTTVVPALLMGNVVIGKTPRFGGLASQALLDALNQSFPAGVISVLPGNGRTIIPAVMKGVEKNSQGKVLGPAVNVLAFIGSAGAADAVIREHPMQAALEKVLGLGAKNAAVVLPGADVDAVAKKIVKGALGFNGQRCTAEKIVFVPRAEAARYAAQIALGVAALKVGMPWEDGVAITPLPEDDKAKAMQAMIEDAVDKGAKVMNPKGGTSYHSVMRPAVLFPVTSDMRIAVEEQFGPIIPIVPYDDIAEIGRWHKETGFGQQAAIFGEPRAAVAVASMLASRVARINVNDNCQRGPDNLRFTVKAGGSGFGTLSLREALTVFSQVGTVVSQDPKTLDIVAPPTTAAT